MFRKEKKEKPGKVRGPKTPEQRKRANRISVLAIGGLAIAATAGLFIVPGMMTKEDPAVPVVAMSKGDIQAILDTSGMVESMKTKTYFSPVNANIRQCAWKVGDAVEKGSILVTFNTDTLEQDNQKAQLTKSANLSGSKDTEEKARDTQAKAAVAAGNASSLQGSVEEYEGYISSLKSAIADRTRELTQWASDNNTNISLNLSRAGTDLRDATSIYQEKEAAFTASEGKIIQLEGEIQALEEEKELLLNGENQEGMDIEARLKQLEKKIADKQTLMEKEKEILDQAQEAKNSAKAAMDQAQADVDYWSEAQIINGSAADPSTDDQIIAWQNELEQASGDLAELQSELAKEESIAESGESAKVSSHAKKQMEANDNLTELEAASLEELLEKGRQGIVSEFNGIVSKAELTEGAAVGQGSELITVASNEEVAVNATISKYDYNRLKVGQKAEIVITNNTYKGSVASISKIAKVNEKGAPIISCQVKIENPDDAIFLGVEAKVSIYTDSANDVDLVPVNAVNTGKDGQFCYVVEDGVIVKKDVETGVVSTDYIEIKEGLNKEDPIIVQMPQGFSEGMRVTPVDNAEMQAGVMMP